MLFNDALQRRFFRRCFFYVGLCDNEQPASDWLTYVRPTIIRYSRTEAALPFMSARADDEIGQTWPVPRL
jgi:hypothetical protein